MFDTCSTHAAGEWFEENLRKVRFPGLEATQTSWNQQLKSFKTFWSQWIFPANCPLAAEDGSVYSPPATRPGNIFGNSREPLPNSGF